MAKAIDLTGKKFGKLTVEEYTGSRTSGSKVRRFYRAKCECGGMIEAVGESFKSGRTKSCGCLRWQSGPESPKWGGHGEISGNDWDHVLRGAEQRNFVVSISIKEAWELFLKQEKRCALSGLPLTFGGARNKGKTASLDRIDSKQGYVIGNVQWVHKDVNRMKQHFDESYFLRLCRTVIEHQEKG